MYASVYVHQKRPEEGIRAPAVELQVVVSLSVWVLGTEHRKETLEEQEKTKQNTEPSLPHQCFSFTIIFQCCNTAF